MSFHVGQKVVCVDASLPETLAAFSGVLRLGAVYTIRDIIPLGQGSPRNMVGLCLEEIIGQQSHLGHEFAWQARRFRPIVERKTDIGFAHEILKKVTRKQTERA